MTDHTTPGAADALTYEQIESLYQQSHVDAERPVYGTNRFTGEEETTYEPTRIFNPWMFARAVEKAALTAPAAVPAPAPNDDGLIFKFECFIDHATGGKLSKSSWALATLKAAHDEHLNGYVDAALAERAPSAAAPSESPGFTTPYPLLNTLLEETFWLGEGPNNHDTVMYWLDALQTFLGSLAAPSAAAPSAAIDAREPLDYRCPTCQSQPGVLCIGGMCSTRAELASRSEAPAPSAPDAQQAAPEGEALTALRWCGAALQAVIDSRGERGSINMILSGEKKSLDDVLDLVDAALAAPEAVLEDAPVTLDTRTWCNQTLDRTKVCSRGSMGCNLDHAMLKAAQEPQS